MGAAIPVFLKTCQWVMVSRWSAARPTGRAIALNSRITLSQIDLDMR
ncbi:hypothetical protein GGE16_001093 [Rhizobium leguminosarum]|uniref:Uncharacterized protein n=1 Tax=Rhizobium leguminosarum TaxID=384 RepID=A0AAE2SV32_RHILE|nr:MULTISPECIES: hypothetical protein [Rhizobium]MBB4289077.1 hypothetical protein [Rhizobium leguminosarum]MBB4294830.1 hypothetical protein [Rhizobium leguminosarum]MBB4306223.1 hypothetical protein [Rhizobium leguminosarum]MBB4418196.1 hypothetical protein [Rhizobium leguminosarum]MBB4433042.1 hypothetical protein [Rhizobium esperanzae]